MQPLYTTISHNERLGPEAHNHISVHQPYNLPLFIYLHLHPSNFCEYFSILHQLDTKRFMEWKEDLFLGSLVNIGEQMVACIVQEMPYHAQWCCVFTELFQYFPYMTRVKVTIRCKDLNIIFFGFKQRLLLVSSSWFCFFKGFIGLFAWNVVVVCFRLRACFFTYCCFMFLVGALKEATPTGIRVNPIMRQRPTPEIQASIYNRYSISLQQLIQPVSLDSIDEDAESSRPTADDEDIDLLRALSHLRLSRVICDCWLRLLALYVIHSFEYNNY